MNTPEITGNRALAKVTHSDYNGKLVLDTLLPEPDNALVGVVEGGEGDAWVNGINYYADVKPGLRNEGGGARIEISPAKSSELDYFLNVLQVSDADKNYYKTAQKLETSSHVGVIIADRIVLFAKARNRIGEDVIFTFDGEEAVYQILVCDCKGGVWEVYCGDKLVSEVNVPHESGILSFEALPGDYKVRYKG